jgi:hypothetical protein
MAYCSYSAGMAYPDAASAAGIAYPAAAAAAGIAYLSDAAPPGGYAAAGGAAGW